MHTFGTGGLTVAFLFGCGLYAFEVGWSGVLWVAAAVLVYLAGWSCIVGDANRNYRPDGTRRTKPARRGGNRRGRPR